MADDQPAATSPAPAAPAAPGGDVLAQLRTPGYLKLLVLAALIGVPVSAAAWGFTQAVTELQDAFYDNLPHWFGYQTAPVWWPLPLLAVSGVLVTVFIRYLPGNGGHCPADGFTASGTEPSALPGVVLAAAAGLTLGIVLGPEAPLIAIGSGLGMLAARLALRGQVDQAPMAPIILAASGSFAALGTILGSPIVAAVFLMEAIGLGGPLLTMVLLPGLLAAGLGSLIFIGLGAWGGLGLPTLSIPAQALPPFHSPTAADLGWAVVMGLGAALLAAGIRKLTALLRPHVEGHRFVLMPAVGLAVAGIAIAFSEWMGRGEGFEKFVLFSGQSGLGQLVAANDAGKFTVDALIVLGLAKAVAYSLSLSGFRGGPIFPSLFVGAAAGLAAAHLPGFDEAAALAVGLGAMSAAMLRLPLSSILLASLIMGKTSLTVAPVIIVAVVVAYVAGEWLSPRPAPAPAAAPAPATG